MGECRILGSDQNLERGLQRKINGHWYQYVPPQHLTDIGIPHSLLSDHTHWVATVPTEKAALLISRRASGRTIASMGENGELWSGDEQVIAWDKTHPLSQFDKPEYIMATVKEGKLTSLNFTRYHSHKGDPLCFKNEQGLLQYQADKDFYLYGCHNDDAALGVTCPYLLLQSVDQKKSKILLPHGTFEAHASLTNLMALVVEDEREKDLLFTHQNWRWVYLEFDVVKGKLIPQTPEGKIFLAYLYFATRHYQKALEHLNSYDILLESSLYTCEMLLAMVAISSSHQDGSPQAAAIALHAWCLCLKIRSREPSLFEQYRGIWGTLIEKPRTRYIRFAYKIPHILTLSEEQHRMLHIEKRNLPATVKRNADPNEKALNIYRQERKLPVPLTELEFRKQNLTFMPHSEEDLYLTHSSPLLLTESHIDRPEFFFSNYKITKMLVSELFSGLWLLEKRRLEESPVHRFFRLSCTL